MDLQVRNWENFCHYHTGEWKGNKKRYSPEGKVIKTWDVITHLQVNQDNSQITHQDELFYSDGTHEVKNYGIYQKPKTSALFLDSTFCWGSKMVKSDSIFIFEFGFRHEDKRVLCYFRYDESGQLQYSSTGVEYLNNEDTQTKQNNEVKTINKQGKGFRQKMTPDLIISEPIETSWKPIEELNNNYLIQKFDDNIVASCPQTVDNNSSFLIAVDWQVNDELLKRGIVYYEKSVLSYFTVETFNAV
ncbi:DUF3598 family protein [Crocosphaera sp.]|uniref:DUF3598 family protein n=1 Tax=Crocosphaera sp. TaxID=2729996 RepID=UPI003F23D687|nr:DUF3598 family protein [Crocosphaera sp.]